MKINTVNSKQEQLKNGAFKSGSGSEVIFIMGSCRSVPYANYLSEWNEKNGNRFTIYLNDPFNYHWNEKDERIDYDAKMLQLESDEKLLNIFKSTKIFIHEYYRNAGLFNVEKFEKKNIYQFGMNPEIDICIPNFDGMFILVNDILSFDVNMRTKAIQDFNVIGKLSQKTLDEIYLIAEKNLNKFYDICSKTSLPEFAEIFKNNYLNKRYWWTQNHITKEFTQTIFKLINDKFLHLENLKLSEVDMYANNYTHLCEYDSLNWNEEKIKLKL